MCARDDVHPHGRVASRARVAGESGADVYRELFLALLSRVPARGSMWVVITSALRREGVTTIARGLWHAMAESSPAILLDLNWRHPSPTMPDEGGGRSFSDAVSAVERAQPSEFFQGRRRVSIAAARGGDSPSPETLTRLISWIRPYCRYGVIDAPALLSGVEALPAAPVVDGCVIVVEAGKTPSTAAARARDIAASAGLPPLGAVLNKYRDPVPSRLFGRLG